MKKEIGKRVNKYRKLANMKQSDLAAKLGVTNSAVSNWESGKNGIDVELIPSLCQVLNISVSDLLGAPPNEKQLSPEALAVAYAYDSMSDYGKAIIGTIMQIELKPNSLDPVTLYNALQD